ncbi:MAG TPA: cation diffusion facilitator family transporter [Casimicrobiaceae bacterium]|nr:cation diffusion facilitator family transporter [Casimicrobiaceae bacterium]
MADNDLTERMHPHRHPSASAERRAATAAHGHSHANPPAGEATLRALTLSLAATIVFAVVEAIAGWFAGSLALLSDAGHMVADAASLGLALLAYWISRRPPSRRASYGYARAEVLAAFVNALALLVLVVFITIEAVRRLLVPQPVAGGVVLGVAFVGLLVNVVTAWMLSRAGSSLNVRGALLHVLSDMLGSVAAIVAGAVILFTGWTPIDPILSLVVSLLILRSSWRLLAQSTGVLMEGVPSNLDYEEIGRALAKVPGIVEIHDLHVWHMSSERAALSAHLLIREPAKWPETLAAAQRLLAERFHIDHVTLQPTWHQPPSGKRVIPVTPVAVDGEPRLH